MSAVDRVARAYARMREMQRPEIWIALRPEEDVLAEARELEDRGGEELPLLGTLLAVKDNIDVAGLPTTAGFPGLHRLPVVDAPAVARLRSGGAIVLGKTNLDQFATGLVGTRSPHGAVRNAGSPHLISGGSSSGSAVAVALGIADIALGTDTAGSGRVPAALNGIFGIKPTLGTVPTTGMLDACRPFDTITVFARTLADGTRALGLISGPDGVDPAARPLPEDVKLAASTRPILVVPAEADLSALSPSARSDWDDTIVRLAEVADVREADISPLLRAARLLYGGAIVAGRYAAVGQWVDGEESDGLDPTVAGIVRGARSHSGWEYVRDREQLDRIRLVALEMLAGADGLVIPTAPGHPSLDEVAADPVAVNAWMGTYTNFVNLLDLAAIAVPIKAPVNPAGGFGVSIVTRAFEDQVGIDIAALLLGEPAPELPLPGSDLAVFGAHLTGQPLNSQLTDRGARFSGAISTAPDYRLYALQTSPPKPGLVPRDNGQSIRGELWRLTRSGLGSFLAELLPPMTLGRVRLDDGREVVGFSCTADALSSAIDITEYGGWLEYLAQQS